VCVKLNRLLPYCPPKDGLNLCGELDRSQNGIAKPLNSRGRNLTATGRHNNLAPNASLNQQVDSEEEADPALYETLPLKLAELLETEAAA
jgi:hypothetical protein